MLKDFHSHQNIASFYSKLEHIFKHRKVFFPAEGICKCAATPHAAFIQKFGQLLYFVLQSFGN